MSTQSIETLWSNGGPHQAQTLKLDSERAPACLDRHSRNIGSETDEGDPSGSGTPLVTMWVSGGKEFTVKTYPKTGESSAAHQARHDALVAAGKIDYPEDP